MFTSACYGKISSDVGRHLNYKFEFAGGEIMKDFNDSEYAGMIGRLLHDTRYLEISNMGKLAGLRKHAEVMVRKILNIGSDTKIMLGQVRNNSSNSNVNNGINNLGDELSSRLIEIVSRISPLGNEGTHTQHTEEFSEEEVEEVENALLDLYALIFIKYFRDIHVDLYSSPQVLSEFSFLPPNIRYKTWDYLFEKDKYNIQVVNRLCLSIIKTFNKDKAYKWLEDNSVGIKSIPYPTDGEIEKYLTIAGVEVEPGLYQVSLCFDKFDNMYDLLYDKIKDPRTSINESGKMYKLFEEAIKYYNQYKDLIFPNNSEDVATFHSLMEFVFLGRESKEELYDERHLGFK